MWATNPPPKITGLRTVLAACPSWSAYVTAGRVSSAVHYPSAALAVEQGSSDTLPFAILAPGQSKADSYAAGAAGVPSGVSEIYIYADDDSSDLETLADALCIELPRYSANTDGALPIRSVSVVDGRASDPTPGQHASGDAVISDSRFRMIALSVEHGLSL